MARDMGEGFAPLESNDKDKSRGKGRRVINKQPDLTDRPLELYALAKQEVTVKKLMLAGFGTEGSSPVAKFICEDGTELTMDEPALNNIFLLLQGLQSKYKSLPLSDGEKKGLGEEGSRAFNVREANFITTFNALQTLRQLSGK